MGKLDRVETGWTVEDFMSVHQGVLRLRSLDLDLPLAEIYEDVDFTESE